jgi:hypothetical protein
MWPVGHLPHQPNLYKEDKKFEITANHSVKCSLLRVECLVAFYLLHFSF